MVFMNKISDSEPFVEGQSRNGLILEEQAGGSVAKRSGAALSASVLVFASGSPSPACVCTTRLAMVVHAGPRAVRVRVRASPRTCAVELDRPGRQALSLDPPCK